MAELILLENPARQHQILEQMSDDLEQA